MRFQKRGKGAFILVLGISLPLQTFAMDYQGPLGDWFGKYFALAADLDLVTNYIWRGISQTNNRPAMQGDFILALKSGLYGKVWGSNVNFSDPFGNPATSEMDAIAGFKSQFYSLDYDIFVTRYMYPDTQNLNFTEYNLALAWNIWRVSIAYSSEIFHTDSAGIYYTFGIEAPIPETKFYLLNNVIWGAKISYYHFSQTFANYLVYQIYANKKLSKTFALGISWTNTNGAFGANKLDGSQIVGILSATFA